MRHSIKKGYLFTSIVVRPGNRRSDRGPNASSSR